MAPGRSWFGAFWRHYRQQSPAGSRPPSFQQPVHVADGVCPRLGPYVAADQKMPNARGRQVILIA
jgi:hypothetical protein